jgi:hypothetical protein
LGVDSRNWFVFQYNSFKRIFINKEIIKYFFKINELRVNKKNWLSKQFISEEKLDFYFGNKIDYLPTVGAAVSNNCTSSLFKHFMPLFAFNPENENNRMIDWFYIAFLYCAPSIYFSIFSIMFFQISPSMNQSQMFDLSEQLQ